MIDVDVLCEFVENYLVDYQDREIKVHAWMRDEVFRPLYGFKLWPADEYACSGCRERVGEIVSRKRRIGCNEPKCGGLESHKVRVVVLKMARQQGKTTTGACVTIAEMALGRNSNVVYVGASEDQGKRTFDEKFGSPVSKNKDLAKHLHVYTDGIKNPRKNNVMKFIPASHRAGVGGTNRLVIVDEARDLDAKVIIRLMPTIIAADGSQCPRGCFSTTQGEHSECPSCSEEMTDYYGAALIMSNAGEDEGWFYELVKKLQEKQFRAFHLFDTAEQLNDNSSTEAISDINEVFVEIPQTAHLVRQEFNNEFTRAGDEYLPREVIESHVMDLLPMVEGSSARCVAFFDASRTQDLSSLAICIDPATLDGKDTSRPFERMDLVRIDIWDPAKLPKHRVNYKAVRRVFAQVLPRFPRLIELRVDVAMINEAQELVDYCREHKWGRNVHPWTANPLLNKEIWDSLERRMLSEPAALRLPNHKRLVDELVSLRVQVGVSGTHKVVDPSNRHGRGRMHRDISYSLAGCCWIADMFALNSAKPDRVQSFVNANKPVMNTRKRDTVSSLRGYDW